MKKTSPQTHTSIFSFKLTIITFAIFMAAVSCDKPNYPDRLQELDNTVWKYEYTKIRSDYLLPETNDVYHIKFKNKKVMFFHNYRNVGTFYEPEPRAFSEYHYTEFYFETIGTITYDRSSICLELSRFPLYRDNISNHPDSSVLRIKNIFFLTNEKL